MSKLRIEQIRQLSLLYAEGRMWDEPDSPAVPDQGWLDAYAEAIFVAAYSGRCTFEHDGITVTLIDHTAP